MLRVRVYAAHMGEFLGRNSPDKGSFLGRFSINMGGLSRNWRKMAKNGSFSAKIHHKSGYDSKLWQLEEGIFLKTRWQAPIHPQVMYPPPQAPVSNKQFFKNGRLYCVVVKANFFSVNFNKWAKF